MRKEELNACVKKGSVDVWRTLTGYILLCSSQTVLNTSQTPVSLHLAVWNRQHRADYSPPERQRLFIWNIAASIYVCTL